MKQRRNVRGKSSARLPSAVGARSRKRGEQDGRAGSSVRQGERREISKGKIFAVVVVLVALTGAAFVANVLPAWRQTQMREAYLPQLATQATHDPTNGDLLALLGGRTAQAGNHSAAISTLLSAISAGDNVPVVWETLAGEAALSGNRPLAQTALFKGETTTNGSPDIVAALNRLQSVPSSAGPAEVAMAVDPGGPDALVTAYASGSYLNGVADWWGRAHPDRSGFATRQQWAAQSPNDPTALRYWGLALDENGRSEEASGILQSAEVLAPNDPQVHLDLAEALGHTGNLVLASSEYIRALQLKPNLVDALLGLGTVMFQRSNTALARVCFLNATKLAPESIDAWVGLGRSDEALSAHTDECVNAFQTASRINPSRTDFIDDWALALIYANDFPEAEEMLNRYVAAHQADVDAQFELGHVIMHDNPIPARLAQAEAHTRAALQVDPTSPLALTQLGDILLRQHKTTASMQVLERARSERPNSVTTLRLLARAYAANGDAALASESAAHAQAIDDLLAQETALSAELFQRYMDVGYHKQLLAVFQDLGQTADAAGERSIIQALTTDPYDVAAKRKAYDNVLTAALGSEATVTPAPPATN
jgi:tetratricopeptide (TPR) repeat protein